MKLDSNHLPKFLSVLPALDHYIPGNPEEGGGGGGVNVSYFDTVNFNMISSSPAHPGEITNYTEVKMESPADGGTVPISSDNDAERNMLIMGLPKPGADWNMSLTLSGPVGSDTISILTLDQEYIVIRSTLPAGVSVVMEDPGLWFTVKMDATNFITYVFLNQANQTVKLSYTQENTFDWFRVCFLAMSNG